MPKQRRERSSEELDGAIGCRWGAKGVEGTFQGPLWMGKKGTCQRRRTKREGARWMEERHRNTRAPHDVKGWSHFCQAVYKLTSAKPAASRQDIAQLLHDMPSDLELSGVEECGEEQGDCGPKHQTITRYNII